VWKVYVELLFTTKTEHEITLLMDYTATAFKTEDKYGGFSPPIFNCVIRESESLRSLSCMSIFFHKLASKIFKIKCFRIFMRQTEL
jgi:hypothetical protein